MNQTSPWAFGDKWSEMKRKLESISMWGLAVRFTEPVVVRAVLCQVSRLDPAKVPSDSFPKHFCCPMSLLMDGYTEHASPKS